MPWWFDNDPDRLAYELRKLDEAGFSYSVRDDGRETGLLRLEIVYPDSENPEDPSRTYALIAAFPEEYPDFPFEIWVQSGSNFPPGPHLNPTGNLCLLQDSGNNWDGSRDFLAAFLQRQVRDILRVHRGDKTVLEAEEGLRQTGYIQYQPGTAMVVGDWVIPAEINHGTFLWRHFPLDSPHRHGRGVVTEIRTAGGDLLGQLTLGKRWDSMLHGSRQLSGRWVRLPSIPRSLDPLAEARSIWPELATMTGATDLTGLLIPEEKERGGSTIDNWVFCLRTFMMHPQRGQLLAKHTLIRAEQFSNETKWARAPRATHIANKKALIVGLGAIGAPLAWQMARAGIGELCCVDYDSVQIGNLPRWLYGMPEIGESKAACVAANLQLSYPPLLAEGIEYQIGAVSKNDACHQRFQASLDEADILVDATGQIAVNRYLEKLARGRNIPYVWAYGSNGGWGGVIGRSVPGRAVGCYDCVQWRMLDALDQTQQNSSAAPCAIMPPPAEDLPDVQPVGCFNPTFRGTGFDMDQVSQMAARLVVATLCRDTPPGANCYPDFPWDVAVLSQWNSQTGLPTVPIWTTYILDRHPSCLRHDD
jgi:molybdopterin/thiamine biosynthesis adenylyltransferase